MKTKVLMKRELFGMSIAQQSDTQFFSATDLSKAGSKWRLDNGLSVFNLHQYLKSKSFLEFKEEVENKYGSAVIQGRGRNSNTWVHPLLFIDISLAINPKLKVEVYDWLFDNLIKFRNDSGDSYREMCSSLYMKINDKKKFPDYINRVANYIKKELGVDDWQNANEEQLKKRDKIHNAIKLLCNVLNNTDQAVRIGVKENL